MSITFAVGVYLALVAFVSALMTYYFRVMYPMEEAQLKQQEQTK